MGAFGYRLNGVAAHLDTGIDYSQGSRYVASGTFDFKPTDRLTITADVEYFEKSIVEPALFLLTIPSGATSVNIPDVSLVDRSEERRVGKGWVSTCRSRWSPDH